MAFASGANFAGYVVVRILGSAGAGEVYLVRDPRSGHEYALKILPLEMSADVELQRRFLRETKIATKLRHPHIVEVHDRGQFGGQLWIAMDYVNATNLGQVMREKFPAGMPVGEVCSIVTAAAAALDYAHQRGMLHREVKPGSILLTGPGDGEQRILLTDFGITRRLCGGSQAVSTLTLGTVAYAAPEQLMGSDIDERTDQYSLAATAFRLLTGAPPYGDSNSVDAISERLNAAPPSLGARRPDLAHLDAAMSKALATDPAHRFARCSDFAVALAERAAVASGESRPGGAFALDYPAYAWSDLADIPRTQSAAGPVPVAAEPAQQAPTTLPTKRSPRKILLGTAAVALVAGLLALGFAIGRKTDNAPRAASPPASGPATAAVPPPPSAAPGPPAPLDGTYRIEVQRAQQTFDYTPNPQPPNVNTWWAFRSSCTPSYCSAAAIQLDNTDHTQPNAPGGRPVVMRFADGHWQSEPETGLFPCVGKSGSAHTQTMTQVLILRPNPRGDLVGEMTVTVQSNECGQQSAVIRVPTVATRSGDTPPGVYVPDPVTIGGAGKASGPPTTADAPDLTGAPTPTATAPSGPGR